MNVYKNYWYLLLFTLILGMTGCKSNGIKESAGVNIDDSIMTVSSVNESMESKVNNDIYINIVDQYVDAINNDLFYNNWNSIGSRGIKST